MITIATTFCSFACPTTCVLELLEEYFAASDEKTPTSCNFNFNPSFLHSSHMEVQGNLIQFHLVYKVMCALRSSTTTMMMKMNIWNPLEKKVHLLTASLVIFKCAIRISFQLFSLHPLRVPLCFRLVEKRFSSLMRGIKGSYGELIH